jgi:hypothetical protein
MGASVFGLDDIYQKLHPFIKEWKKDPSRQLYFASVDIKKCFDTIHQSHLFEMIQDMFKEVS